MWAYIRFITSAEFVSSWDALQDDDALQIVTHKGNVFKVTTFEGFICTKCIYLNCSGPTAIMLSL